MAKLTFSLLQQAASISYLSLETDKSRRQPFLRLMTTYRNSECTIASNGFHEHVHAMPSSNSLPLLPTNWPTGAYLRRSASLLFFFFFATGTKTGRGIALAPAPGSCAPALLRTAAAAPVTRHSHPHRLFSSPDQREDRRLFSPPFAPNCIGDVSIYITD